MNCANNCATQSHNLAPAGNNLCKKVFPLFSYLAGRDCVAAMCESAKEGSLFLRSFGGAVFISCDNHILTLIPTLFVVENNRLTDPFDYFTWS